MLGSRPLATAPLATLPSDLVVGTQTVTMRYASEGFITRSTDAPADTYIAGRIASGLEIGRELTRAADGQFGSLIEARFGEIALNNDDKALDSLINDYYADGREIRLKIGAKEIVEGGARRVRPFSSFALVYTAIGGAWGTDRRDVVRLRVQTLAARLQDRLQTLTYAGSGGENGTANMAGRTRPLVFGHCQNVTVQIVNPFLLTGQLHSRSISEVTTVYDQGIEVPFSANYPTYAALESAMVAPGTYATSLATGWIRMGSALGTITATVKGDNVGGYVNTHSEIIRRLVLDFSSLALGNIDGPSFAAYTTAQSAEMGIFFPAGDQSSVEEAIERIAFSGGAFAGQDRSGLYRVQQLALPAMVPHWIFDDRDIIEIDRELLPYGVPWGSWGVGYAKNWTVQKGGDLAAGVTQTRRTFLESEYRYAFTSNAGIALAHQTSSGAPLRASLFVEQADAEVEAERLIGFYALGRAMYRFSVKTVLFSVEIGQTIRLIFPRWNLASGRNFVVLSVADDAATRRTEMICFG